jgi:hypothetical protein
MRLILLLGTIALITGNVAAGPVVYDTFGNFPAATFGGAGIPTDPTAVTSFTYTVFDTAGGSHLDTITLGLTAHQRFSNPALTNDGEGTFFATSGGNDGFGNAGTAATWNFGFYAALTGDTATFANYSVKLYYGKGLTNPSSITPEVGVWDLSATGLALGQTTAFQGSENLTFSFLQNGVPLFVSGPTSPFDATLAGEYDFGMVVQYVGPDKVAKKSTRDFDVAIVVNSSDPVGVPDGGTLVALLSFGMLNLWCFSRLFPAKSKN